MAMAVQTGMSSSKVLILVGAGLTGSIILRNGRISDVLSDLQGFMKGINEGDTSNNHYDTAFLASQIKHLAQEIRELAISRPVTIVNGENSTDVKDWSPCRGGALDYMTREPLVTERLPLTGLSRVIILK